MNEYKDVEGVDESGAFIEHIGTAPTHEELVVRIDRRLAGIEAALARTEAAAARTAELNNKIDALTQMTARAPSGATLINLVAQIHAMCEEEFD